MSVVGVGLTPKMKPVSHKRTTVVGALDIGTSKVACVIAKLKPHTPAQGLRSRSHAIETIGFGHVASRGMKAGNVIDLAAAEGVIRQALDIAEQQAGIQLESIIISISAGRPGSVVEAPPGPRPASRGDRPRRDARGDGLVAVGVRAQPVRSRRTGRDPGAAARR